MNLKVKQIDTLLNLDWLKFPRNLVLVVLFFVSRMPLLNLGFGADGDAWRIATAAFDLRHYGIYHVSRLPGFPLCEIFYSLVIDWGWVVANVCTMVISLISVFFFAKILRKLGIKNKGMIVLTYAFMPVLWVNSANSMDYMWALSFIIICWSLLLERAYLLGGVFMGLAIGSRISSALFLIPFLYLVRVQEKRGTFAQFVQFAAMSLAVSLFLFYPVFLRYGWGFIGNPQGHLNILQVGNKLNRVFGLPGLVFGISTILFFREEKSSADKKDWVFTLLAVLPTSVLFAKVPHEAEYLIPCVPFLLVLVGKISQKIPLIILCLILASNSFVTFCVGYVNDDGEQYIKIIDKGLIRRTREIATRNLEYAEKLLRMDDYHSLVIAFEYFPVLRYFVKVSPYSGKVRSVRNEDGVEVEIWKPEIDIHYRYLVTQEEIRGWLERGYKIYYVEKVRFWIKTNLGFDLKEFGAVYIGLE